MHTLLVANRGEIAVRVFRTAGRMGLRCVAVHSDADGDAPFVRMADAAVRIGPAPAAESYLRIDAIVDAALQTGATLVHPGYGFLAEDAGFADACAKAGLTFVGPPADVLRAMGAKDEAKRIARAAGVPVLDGYEGDDRSDGAFASAADAVGYPVIVKPAGGGGGKGMAVVREASQLPVALAAARRIAVAAFGDDRLLLERYLDGPRHVEVQILADSHGTVVHLGERDCSLQRRHQKILEESPSPAIDDATRTRLCDAAVALARAAGYVNAGTCEFLVAPDGTAGFIEMNARLQVEHPVTELVAGVDLVELQLRIAMGETLDVHHRRTGHAIEARIYAEDEAFLPQAGRLLHVRWPDGVRVDAGVEEGSEVTTHYDPMLAKLVVHASDRASALEALRDALARTQILGVRTNVPFLSRIASDPDVAAGAIHTGWLDAQAPSAPPERTPAPVLHLAAAAAVRDRPRSSDPWDAIGAWPSGALVVVDEQAIRVGGRDVRRATGCHAWEIDGVQAAVADGWVWWDGRPWEVTIGARERRADETGAAHLGAPMPGQVIAVRVSAGETVTRGQELVVVEAMKMEHAVTAPSDGVVDAVRCAVGDQVARGQTLVDLET